MRQVIIFSCVFALLFCGESFAEFIDNGDGTVTDTSTELMWQQETASAMNWEAAIVYCEGLSLAGHNDWRLPTIKELASIVDLAKYNPAIDTGYFPNTVSSYYWSSTTDAYFTDNAWLVHFGSGHGGHVCHKSDSYYARAVRGGQGWLLGHLVISAPAQASRWDAGSLMPITWDTQDIAGNVKISLSRQGGKEGTFETLVESTENDGSYEWTVTGPASVNCMLKIEPLNDTSKGTAQGLFSITGDSGNNAPNTPSSPSPSDQTSSVSIDTTLSWTGGDPDTGDTVTYDVYFGTSSTPPSVATDYISTTYDPGTLEYETTYYWKIVARDNNGAEAEGPVWSFTTGPAPDIEPPSPPYVTGTTPTNDATPTSSWGSGGGGNGTYRYKLDDSDVTTGATETTATSFTPANALADGSHTLYVQERDDAGNWSASGSFTIVIDTTPPTVSLTSPANGAADVAVNTSITSTFSETMDSSTITTAIFTVSTGGGNISGTVTYSGTIATFEPSSNLKYGTTYTATITIGVKDSAGNSMGSDYTWSFTTVEESDTTPPSVSLTIPADGATDVPINATVTATFSEEIDSSTINTSTFTVSKGGYGISGSMSYGGTTATFTPSSNLEYSATYTATITTAVKDLAGNSMSSNYSWSFTTGEEEDTKKPVITDLSDDTAPAKSKTWTWDADETATFRYAIDEDPT